MDLISEPLYPNIKPFEWELALFKSKPVRRLKHLAHFGAGALVSPVVHSRYEHTIGVWKLVSLFFPDAINLRVAAILHDIGHLPFSHAVEVPLGFDHHQLTRNYIQEQEITHILESVEIESKTIIDLLDMPTVITGKGKVLGLDHLDSFFRDTYMSGQLTKLPGSILANLTCTAEGIETDRETGCELMTLILADHQLFLSPYMVAVDRLLAEAVKAHWLAIDKVDKYQFARMTDADLIFMLQHSPSDKARQLIDTILFNPAQIKISKQASVNSYPISVRKIYNKLPRVNTTCLNEANRMEEKLAGLAFDEQYVSV
nr:HD domain-containing protein [Amphibacillus cookii]